MKVTHETAAQVRDVINLIRTYLVSIGVKEDFVGIFDLDFSYRRLQSGIMEFQTELERLPFVWFGVSPIDGSMSLRTKKAEYRYVYKNDNTKGDSKKAHFEISARMGKSIKPFLSFALDQSGNSLRSNWGLLCNQSLFSLKELLKDMELHLKTGSQNGALPSAEQGTPSDREEDMKLEQSHKAVFRVYLKTRELFIDKRPETFPQGKYERYGALGLWIIALKNGSKSVESSRIVEWAEAPKGYRFYDLFRDTPIHEYKVRVRNGHYSLNIDIEKSIVT